MNGAEAGPAVRSRPTGDDRTGPAEAGGAAGAPEPRAADPGATGDPGAGAVPPAASRIRRHGAVAWPEARGRARRAARPLPTVRRPLHEALGHALAVPLAALTDLPSFDTSAMDGWAVAGDGSGPWRLSGQLLAGDVGRPLPDGHAVGIATGAAMPPGATAVLRREHGRVDEARGLLRSAVGAVRPGQDVRPRGQECRAGDELLGAGMPVTPAVLGLAAAAGYDELVVVRLPRVEVLVLGDELLDRGLPAAGRVRDALGPLLPPWLRALGADVTAVRRLVDDADALYEALRGSDADVIVTSGGTAGGPVDFVHPVLARLGAKTLVDGVAVRPGHPMLLASLPSGGHLVGLPGNPLAAVSGVLTLAEPLIRTLGGRAASVPHTALLAAEVSAHPTDTRLVPVVFDDSPTAPGASGAPEFSAAAADASSSAASAVSQVSATSPTSESPASATTPPSVPAASQTPAVSPARAVPLHFNGPAMLRGIAVADGVAVIPPGGPAAAGSETAVLATGWAGGPGEGPGTRGHPARRIEAP